MTGQEYDTLTIQAVRKVAPCVVSIAISKYLPRMQDIGPSALFNPFAWGQLEDGAKEKVKVGGGSGFLVHPSGLILTNKHVVFDPDADYAVLMSDGAELPAKVLSRDPINDIAVIKIDAPEGKKGFPSLDLGESRDIQIGQTVIAIGNALGMFSNSVSRGIVSGLSRTISASMGVGGHSENLRGVIQTDVAINQGNSGGPLVDLQGRVVGINTAVIFGAQNIGFAIPIDWAKGDLRDIIAHGRIIKPFLGLTYVMLTKELAEKYGLKAHAGAMVIRDHRPDAVPVLTGSPAHQAGLQEHDVITEVNGHVLDEKDDLTDLLQNFKVGDTLTLKYLRQGKTHSCKVTLQERK
ncbi:MAG TPA: trypsin-like peptidase domain-containing protein [Candidatus Paceibacterota bacterium]|nr:trypsin-like peptidase domain-containing protein [Candidatus Paceibacterota bacterium]